MKNRTYICHTPYLRNEIISIFGTLVQIDDSSRCFFHFFKILIFQVVSWVKGKKMTQNNKKLCLSHSISQESHIWCLTAYLRNHTSYDSDFWYTCVHSMHWGITSLLSKHHPLFFYQALPEIWKLSIPPLPL